MQVGMRKTEQDLIYYYCLVHTSKHYLSKPLTPLCDKFLEDKELANFCWKHNLAKKKTFKNGVDIFDHIQDHARCMSNDIINGINNTLFSYV